LLQPPSSQPCTGESRIAFGIKRTSRSQLHVALIYRNDVDALFLLHLRGHKDFCHEPWDGTYHWAEFKGITPKLQMLLADHAFMVATNQLNNLIPYSIFLAEGKNFGDDGLYIDHHDGTGLTCATFLLKLFIDLEVHLLALASWPAGQAGDVKWAKGIIEYFQREFPDSHFTFQLERIFKIRRYRPEETVSIPSVYIGVPLTHRQLQGPSKTCLKVLA
jgi:hypothetical protein